ncbi:MAG TPA: hypothetical protein VGG56_07950 [Terracidiphilus sp.]
MAAFSAPGQKRPPDRDLDGLEEDVATLSYERALRAHTRYRTLEPSNRALTQPSEGNRFRFDDAPPAHEDLLGPRAVTQAAPTPTADEESESVYGASTAHDRNLKSASITIRLSQAECMQLRERAAEAGLTISAYLRSCTLEAEVLREQVKATLAQLRSQAAKENPIAISPASSSWFNRLWRLWPRIHSREQARHA